MIGPENVGMPLTSRSRAGFQGTFDEVDTNMRYFWRLSKNYLVAIPLMLLTLTAVSWSCSTRLPVSRTQAFCCQMGFNMATCYSLHAFQNLAQRSRESVKRPGRTFTD